MVERGAGMSVDSTLQVDKRIHPTSFSNHRSLIIFTGKRKLTFPNPLFVPDKGAWPEPLFVPDKGAWPEPPPGQSLQKLFSEFARACGLGGLGPGRPGDFLGARKWAAPFALLGKRSPTWPASATRRPWPISRRTNRRRSPSCGPTWRR